MNPKSNLQVSIRAFYFHKIYGGITVITLNLYQTCIAEKKNIKEKGDLSNI